MYNNKKVLLIGGGGTLGTYTAEELLRLGAKVDILCPEDKVSHHENLRFIQDYATEEVFDAIFAETHYDAVVNFIHYTTLEEYIPHHEKIIANTDQLVFLSSYRVYADEQHPITESAPRLLDVVKDEFFLANETYALPKARCENYLRTQCADQPWTIVRPVISFSQRRMDLLVFSGTKVLDFAKEGKTLIMPECAKNLHAGLDWAGNSGKLIANLLCKKEAIHGTFTVSTAQNLTWGEVAAIYEKYIGLKVRWTDEEEFRQYYMPGKPGWPWVYDRQYDREVDNSAILAATGLTKEDFTSIEDGILTELKNLGLR